MANDGTVPGRALAPAGDDLALPRPPGVLRRFLGAHPVLVDVLVACSYLVPALVAGIVALTLEPSPQLAVRVALAAVAGAALLVRRSRPTAVLAIATVVLAVSVFLGRDAEVIPALYALYAVAVYRSARAAWIGFGAVSVAAVATLGVWTALTKTAFLLSLDTGALPSAAVVIVLCLLSTLLGVTVGDRRRYLAALIARAQQLGRERDQRAVIAAAAERSRIAREMHDIVSHTLTVMVTLADGSARLVRTEPERSATVMEAVAETGRGALADMRRLLGVLGSDGGTASPPVDGSRLAPQPGVGDLTTLVERVREAGLPVRITVTGTPPADTGQQLTVYRVVQEALTNALRHASLATVVAVSIDYGENTIRITVDDDAAVHLSPAHAPGPGRGLIGMRERVALYGGVLAAGPRAGGGWRLRAEFARVPDAGPVPPEDPVPHEKESL
ncbi:MAG TPA: histidine kinase [Leifsonia sp.]